MPFYYSFVHAMNPAMVRKHIFQLKMAGKIIFPLEDAP
jgi:hypothetical protein